MITLPRFMAFRVACLAGVVLLLSACSGAPQTQNRVVEDQTVPVAGEAARVGRLRAVIHASGVVVPAASAEYLVIAPEPARILEIARAEGDTVAAGDVLVRFEMPSATQEVARQTAEVARLQVLLENARVAQERVRDLVGRGMIPRADMNGADRELADAQAAVARAETARRAAETAASRAVVTAPFSGLVVNRFHAVGDLAQALPTDPVMRVVDPGRLQITTSIPVADIARVVQGATAQLAGGLNGEPVRLTVAAPPDRSTLTPDGYVRARLGFIQPAAIAVDTAVEVDIDAEERDNVVFVSPEALIQRGSETSVFVAVGQTAQRRIVRTGVADDQGVEITSGLSRGDIVITRGQAGLADGAAVSVSLAAP